MITLFTDQGMALPRMTWLVRVFFVDAGFVIDVAGLAWLIVSMLLVMYSSRQRISISWAWMAASLQAFIAALGGILVAWAVHLPYRSTLTTIQGRQSPTALEQVSELSLPVILIIAILIWVTFLVWLLFERARFDRRGPTLRDGLRTHTYK